MTGQADPEQSSHNNTPVIFFIFTIMGLKLRMGLAVTGLALSSMFGVNMLAGVKDYVDTTGNIMVDIADGIGMVSKVNFVTVLKCICSYY